MVGVLVLGLIACNGCNSPGRVTGGPEAGAGDQGGLGLEVANTIPAIADSSLNEVEVAGSFRDQDVAWILGALVDLESGEVDALSQGVLASRAETVIKSDAETFFDEIVDVTTSGYADLFGAADIDASSSAKTQAKVTRVSSVGFRQEALDRQRLEELRQDCGTSERKLGVILGFSDYLIEATTFRQVDTQGEVSGAGVKVNGKWYSKSESKLIDHRLVATISSLCALANDTQLDASESTTSLTVRESIIRKRDLIGDFTDQMRVSDEQAAIRLLRHLDIGDGRRD